MKPLTRIQDRIVRWQVRRAKATGYQDGYTQALRDVEAKVLLLREQTAKE